MVGHNGTELPSIRDMVEDYRYELEQEAAKRPDYYDYNDDLVRRYFTCVNAYARMCMYVQIYTYICIYIYILIHIYTHVCTGTRNCEEAGIHIHTQAHTYILSYIHTYIHAYVHMPTHTYWYDHSENVFINCDDARVCLSYTRMGVYTYKYLYT